jgi:hypothetical protein
MAHRVFPHLVLLVLALRAETCAAQQNIDPTSPWPRTGCPPRCPNTLIPLPNRDVDGYFRVDPERRRSYRPSERDPSGRPATVPSGGPNPWQSGAPATVPPSGPNPSQSDAPATGPAGSQPP